MLHRTLHFSRARLSRPVVAFVAAVAVVVISASGLIAAGVETAPGVAQAAGTTAIRRITIATRGPAVVVTIEGSGNLPLPTAGFADEPPRLFFDFPGVTLAGSRMTTSTDPRIRRIRAGVHSAAPLVTRVVLDLVAAETYRVEQATGRITVILGEPVATAVIPPVPPLPERPPATAAPPAARESREPMHSAVPPTVPPLPSAFAIAGCGDGGASGGSAPRRRDRTHRRRQHRGQCRARHRQRCPPGTWIGINARSRRRWTGCAFSSRC